MIRATLGLLLAIATLATLAPSAWAGQFKKAVYYNVGSQQQPYHVIATHLTNSGKVDLAFTDLVSESVSILLGNGNGTFQKALTFAVPAPVGIAAGDFNEDGIQDLAVVENGGTGDGAVALFLGDGHGHFKLSATYSVGVGSVDIAVADFNGDGHLDVAVTNKGFNNGPGNMMTFFGNGHGKLKNRKTYKMTGQPYGIAAGDLNGDGHPDLAVAALQGGTVAILMNDGAGKFGKPVYYSVNGWPTEIRIADLRNNGDQDLVIADISSGLDIWLNNGDGTFGQPTIYVPMFSGAEAPEDCTVADFNLDGNLDVACATNLDDSYFFYGKGDGTFGSAIQIANTIDYKGGFSIASGDFNNDGAPDLAIPIQDYGKVAIMLNTQ